MLNDALQNVLVLTTETPLLRPVLSTMRLWPLELYAP